MTYRATIWTLILLLFDITGYSQAKQSEPAVADDSSFLLFRNPDIIMNIRIFNTEQSDPDQYNAVVVLIKKDGKQVFSDSLYMGRLAFYFEDFNGDGQKDLVMYRHMLASRSNMTYNLYLMDKNRQTLHRVVGFENILNPEYDKKRNLIKSTALFGPYVGWNYHKIDKQGSIRKVSRNYRKRVE